MFFVCVCFFAVFHFAFLLAVTAYAIHVQAMVGYLKVQQLAHHTFYLLYARVAEFNHFFAVYAYYMVVLLMAIAFFVLGQVFTELVLPYQVAAYE